MRTFKSQSVTGLIAVTVLTTAMLAPLRSEAATYVQLPVDGAFGAASDFNFPPTNGQQLADDFMLVQDAVVEHVRWWGLYPGPGGNDDVQTDDFTIRFFRARGRGEGVPRVLPFVSVPPVALARMPTSLTDASGFTVHQYDTFLPAPVALDAATPYYLSIVNNTAAGNWVWMGSDIAKPSFFRIRDRDPWVRTLPDYALQLSEKPVAMPTGPKFNIIKDVLDVGPPLPPPKDIEVFLDGTAPQVPSQIMAFALRSVSDAAGTTFPFTLAASTSSPRGAADLVRIEFAPQNGTVVAESFFDLLFDFRSTDGTALDIKHRRDLNLVDADIFSVWFEVTGALGVTTYHALFETMGGEFSNVFIGDPDGPAFPVAFGLQGEPGFTVTVTGTHVQAIPGPATVWLLLVGIAALGPLWRGCLNPLSLRAHIRHGEAERRERRGR